MVKETGLGLFLPHAMFAKKISASKVEKACVKDLVRRKKLEATIGEACVKEQNMAEPESHLLCSSLVSQKRRKGCELECSVCGEDYAYKQDLASHMSEAHGVELYAAEITC